MAERFARNPIDLRGLSCAFVLARLQSALAGRSTELEVLCDHPTTVHSTVPAYCRRQGYHLQVSPEIYPLNGQVYRLRISAAKEGPVAAA